MLDSDSGEQILRGIERATGTRPEGCPHRAVSDPFVQACLRSLRWFRTGELAARWGGQLPAALALGVECLAAAVDAIEVADMREERARREAEAAAKRGGPEVPRTRIRRKR